MNNILYISGDGIAKPKNNWKNYFNYFDDYSKNYFLTKELKSMVNQCEILNFSHSLRHPEFILKLESLKIIGSTMIRLIIIKIINYIIQEIIIRKIKRNNYDLIIFSDNLFFLNKTLIKNIKEFSTSKVVLLSGVSPKYYLTQSEKDCIPYYDIIFISEYGNEIEWRDLGAKNVSLLPITAGCPNIFQNIFKNYNIRKIYDMSFVGRLDGEFNDYRIKILDFLISHGVDINIWTWQISEEFLNQYPLIKNRILGSAYGKDMVRVCAQSKIVLNMHNPTVWSGSNSTEPSGGNMRLFEIPAVKTLQIADKCPNDWFENGYEIILFDDNDDLLKKVDYYLNNEKERNRIAINGYNKLVKEHTYKHRVEKLIKIIQG